MSVPRARSTPVPGAEGTPTVAGSGTPSARNYERLSRLVKDEIGVKLPANKWQMVEGRLRRRHLALGLATLEDYFRHIFDQGGLESELGAILDALTTNTTDFFREPDHFRLLESRIVPQALLQRGPARQRQGYRVWSAACSTGAEAYSIAMVLQDIASKSAQFSYLILGTDINTEVLATARQAIYPLAGVAPVPKDYRHRFLLMGSGATAGQVRIVPELRARVNFARLNLMGDSHALDRDIDLIFLRNVLIYFEPRDQAQVIARMVAHLAPAGHLVVGHSESMVVRHELLKQIAPAVFQKR
ncbi:CheR family methyltransferase [Paracoccaceae bacterium Fryx2]|nr:CheR family methyltransferase [Paracoccaceae bacterium Fryx2]